MHLHQLPDCAHHASVCILRGSVYPSRVCISFKGVYFLSGRVCPFRCVSFQGVYFFQGHAFLVCEGPSGCALRGYSRLQTSICESPYTHVFKPSATCSVHTAAAGWPPAGHARMAGGTAMPAGRCGMGGGTSGASSSLKWPSSTVLAAVNEAACLCMVGVMVGCAQSL